MNSHIFSLVSRPVLFFHHLKSPQLPCSRISTAPSDSAASWQVSSVFLVRAHYPGADWAPSIDKQQAVTALLLIHDAGGPGQCEVHGTVSGDIWLRIQLLTVKTGSVFNYLPRQLSVFFLSPHGWKVNRKVCVFGCENQVSDQPSAVCLFALTGSRFRDFVGFWVCQCQGPECEAPSRLPTYTSTL